MQEIKNFLFYFRRLNLRFKYVYLMSVTEWKQTLTTEKSLMLWNRKVGPFSGAETY